MAISLEQFQSQIVASELLKPEDVSAFISAFPDDRRPSSAEDLARELVRQQRLTKYQAEQVYAGKGKMLVLGNYVVLDKLGQGGMGVVLKAEHKRLKRPVALKVMSPSVVKTPDALKRFHREVEAAAKLRHPNVVATDDADDAKGTHFLVMEYVEGSDLSVLVKKNGPLSVDQAVQCILQAARGLEFAHSQGVVHRDIKPANLLLDKAGVVKILDMGLARIEGDAGSQGELTSTGAVMGTVDYMAPEQALSTKDADARSDIYSLGISLWYLLTGRCAFEGDSLMAKLLAHRESAIPFLRKANAEVPEAVEAVFRKMVAKQRSDRYQSMTDVIRDLEGYANGTSSSPVNVSMPEITEDLNLQSFLSQVGGPGGPSATTTRQKTVPGPGRVTPNSEATALLGGMSVDTDPQTIATIQSQTRRNTHPTKHFRKSTTAPPWFRNVRVLSAAGGAALILLAAAVFFFSTPHGTLRVEILDPEVELKVRGTELVFRDGRNEPVSLMTGEKRLIVTRGELSFETETFAIKKGQEILVRVELIEDKLVASSNEKVIGEKSIGRSLVTASTTGQRAANAVIVKPQPKNEVTNMLPETGLKFSPGDTVELPMASSPETAECTLEMWLTPAIDIEPLGRSTLFEVSRGGMVIENYSFRFYTFHGHGESKPLLQPGQRIHLAGVNDGKRRLLYLDGQLIATTPDAGHPNPDTTPHAQAIGGSGFRGVMHAARISSVARYPGPFKPPASFESDNDTVALYRFDESSGDVLRDSSGKGQHGKILGAEWVSAEGWSIPASDSTGKVIDLLAMVKLPEHVFDNNFFRSGWRYDDRILLSPSGQAPGILCLDFAPPEEYEINAVVERVDGNDGVVFGVTVDGHVASVCVDQYGGPLSGISVLAGNDADMNETTFRQQVLKNNELNTIRIRVGKRSIYASANGREIIHWEGDPSKLSIWQPLPNPKHVWFGAAYSQFKFHKLELTPLIPSTASTNTPAGPLESDASISWPFDPDDGQEYEWSEAENPGANVNSDIDEWLWGVSNDERWLCFFRKQTAYVSERGDDGAAFGPPQPLLGVQAVSRFGAISADGLTLVHGKTATAPSKGIWLSQRSQLTDAFSEPRPAFSSSEPAIATGILTLSSDGLTLMMSSTQPPSVSSDVWVSTRDNRESVFRSPERLHEPISTIAWDTPFFVSDDSNFVITGVQGSDGATRERRFSYFSRPSKQEPFHEGGSLNFLAKGAQGAAITGGYRLSSNGRSLYLQTPALPGGLGGNDIWVLRRAVKTAELTSISTPLDELAENGYEGFDQIRKVGADDAANGSLKNNFPGISASKGLIVHPDGEPTGTCRVTYELTGRYASFRGIALCRPNRGSPISAEIVADGKSLWKSGDLTMLKSAGAPFEVSVLGVRQLTLIATSEKEMFAAHVLWKEPELFETTADEAKSKALPEVNP